MCLREAEKEFFQLSSKVAELSESVTKLKDSHNLENKTMAATLVQLERKVDESITISNSSVNIIQNRSSRLEDLMRDSELQIRRDMSLQKEEVLKLHSFIFSATSASKFSNLTIDVPTPQLLGHVKDVSKEWNEERMSLDRRLLVSEKIAEDCLERVKLSSSTIESYFLTSPEFLKFQKTSEAVNTLKVEWQGIQNEVRENSNNIIKMQANCAARNDLLELRERVTLMEPAVLEKMPDVFQSVRKVSEEMVSLQTRLGSVKTTADHNSNDVTNLLTRIAAAESTLQTFTGTSTVVSEELRLLAGRVTQLDTTVHRDVSALKDLTGSLSRYEFMFTVSHPLVNSDSSCSRVMSTEGKLAVGAKTAAADVAHITNQIKFLQLKIELLEKSILSQHSYTSSSQVTDSTAPTNTASTLPGNSYTQLHEKELDRRNPFNALPVKEVSTMPEIPLHSTTTTKHVVPPIVIGSVDNSTSVSSKSSTSPYRGYAPQSSEKKVAGTIALSTDNRSDVLEFSMDDSQLSEFGDFSLSSPQGNVSAKTSLGTVLEKFSPKNETKASPHSKRVAAPVALPSNLPTLTSERTSMLPTDTSLSQSAKLYQQTKEIDAGSSDQLVENSFDNSDSSFVSTPANPKRTLETRVVSGGGFQENNSRKLDGDHDDSFASSLDASPALQENSIAQKDKIYELDSEEDRSSNNTSTPQKIAGTDKSVERTPIAIPKEGSETASLASVPKLSDDESEDEFSRKLDSFITETSGASSALKSREPLRRSNPSTPKTALGASSLADQSTPAVQIVKREATEANDLLDDWDEDSDNDNSTDMSETKKSNTAQINTAAPPTQSDARKVPPLAISNTKKADISPAKVASQRPAVVYVSDTDYSTDEYGSIKSFTTGGAVSGAESGKEAVNLSKSTTYVDDPTTSTAISTATAAAVSTTSAPTVKPTTGTSTANLSIK